VFLGLQLVDPPSERGGRILRRIGEGIPLPLCPASNGPKRIETLEHWVLGNPVFRLRLLTQAVVSARDLLQLSCDE
jgi:hypothetical protein